MPADGTTNGWVKIGTSNTSYGILPSASGNSGSGHNYIGTSSWYWKYAYIDEINSTKYKTANYELSESTNSRLSVGNAGQSVAKGLNVGDLLVSSAWADYTKVPTNGIYSKGQIKSGVGTTVAPFVTDSSTLNTNLNADFLDGYHASAFARNATLGTTVAMADAGGTITVEANKIIPVTTTNTSTVTFSFAWTGASNCDIAHILITGSGSSKLINIGDMSTGTTKKNVNAILVTSGGFGEISILYANSTYYIRAVGS